MPFLKISRCANRHITPPAVIFTHSESAYGKASNAYSTAKDAPNEDAITTGNTLAGVLVQRNVTYINMASIRKFSANAYSAYTSTFVCPPLSFPLIRSFIITDGNAEKIAFRVTF